MAVFTQQEKEEQKGFVVDVVLAADTNEAVVLEAK